MFNSLKNISLRAKLMALMLVSLFVATATVTIISITSSTNSLYEANKHQLESMEISKKYEIENYLKQIGGLIVSLANQEGTKSAFKSLKSGFYKLQDKEPLLKP